MVYAIVLPFLAACMQDHPKLRPLDGARISLKDCYDLASIKTTMMSRPNAELYGAVEDSADYVKTPIKLGAVIVERTEMTAFASSDEPTDQYIDFHCPEPWCQQPWPNYGP